jgi:hypothetical protein
MHKYNSKTGLFYFSDGSTAVGYSGRNKDNINGRNNPSLEHVRAYGPIPRGLWDIMGVKDSANTGPYSIILEPKGHDAHGRTLFRIHGNNKANDASKGCIILSPLGLRRKIYQSGIHELEVF